MTSLSDKYRVTYRRVEHFSIWFLVSAAFATAWCAVPIAYGQPPAKTAADESLSSSQRRDETLKWLDKYLADSVLMSSEDSSKILNGVAQMTPSQLDQWLIHTQKLRDYVGAPEWQDTKKWLREFLRVQAIYSDKEIKKLRDDVFNADSDQMLEILRRIQAKHESMVWMHNASKQTQKIDLAERNKSMARQDATNRAARTAASSHSALFGKSGGSAGTMPSVKGNYSIPSLRSGGWGGRYW